VWDSGHTGQSSRKEWSDEVHSAVKKVEDKQWQDDVAARPSLALYSLLKHFPSAEKYLSSNTSREGRLLKFQARTGSLPLNAYLSSIFQSPAQISCRLCVGAELWGSADRAVSPSETIHHFFLDCPYLQELRDGLYARILSSNHLPSSSPARHWFQCASEHERMQWLLGSDMYQLSSAYAESNGIEFSESDAHLYRSLTHSVLRYDISRHVQHYLLLGWRLREHLNGGRITAVRTEISGWSVEMCRPPTTVTLSPPSAAAIAASASDSALYSSVQVYGALDRAQSQERTLSRYVLVVETQCALVRSAKFRRGV
jgi:hypothetical protein